MANRRSKFLVLGLAAAATYGAWTAGSCLLGDDSEAEGTRYVVNHVWLERLPENHRDMIGHLALVDHPQGRVGIAGKSSNWRHFIEAYLWKLDGHRLDLFFPQEEQHAKLLVRSYECEGEAPEPFQLCLELQAGDRKATYYSRRDWKIEPHDVDGSLESLAATAPAVAQHVAAALHGDVAPLVLPTEDLQWQESESLPWQ